MHDQSHDTMGMKGRSSAVRMLAFAFLSSLVLATQAVAQRSDGGPPASPSAVTHATSPAVPASTTLPMADPTGAAGKDLTVTKTVTTTVTKADAAAAAVMHTDLPSDLSVEGMVRAADPIVKGVMGLLAVASVATWSIFLYKFIELAAARSQARADLCAIANAGTLEQVSKTLTKGTVARLARSAELEIAASETLPADGIKERVAIALQRVESAAARRIGVGTGILASVGSTGPFVGLFGTVWGIMNSFIHISNAHTTNLSVVAPGIAEALLATAMGLVAAIPAVVIYNMFSRAITAYRATLGDASAGIMRHVSRDLDRAAMEQYSRVAAE